MSLEIYKKASEILTSKEVIDAPQIYEDVDIDRITVTSHTTLPFEMEGFSVSNDEYQRSKMDYHIYSGENLLVSKLNMPFKRDALDTSTDTLNDYKIDVFPEKDIRTATNLTKGTFTIVYNFLTQYTDNLRIENISADRTELQLTFDTQKNSNI